MLTTLEEFYDDSLSASLEPVSAAGSLDVAGDAGVAAARLGTLRRMTKKEQESYIAGLLDQWEESRRGAHGESGASALTVLV